MKRQTEHKSVFKKKCRIGVVGDILLDHYIVGRVDHISAEAPVPIVVVSGESYAPGGAGNVARNITTLGAQVFLVGAIGDDVAGARVMEELKKNRIRGEGVIHIRAKQTIQKIRIVAEDGQLIRVDREQVSPLSKEAERAIERYVKAHIKEWDALVISDYAKGTLSAALAQKMLTCATRFHTPVIVDTKPKHFSFFKQARVITPNTKEAIATAKLFGKDHHSTLQLGRTLQNISESAVLLTQDKHGVTLFDHDEVTHYPTIARAAKNVVGAGDTVVAALSLALASGFSLKDAARLANLAAGIAVEKEGTSVVTMAELLSRSAAEA